MSSPQRRKELAAIRAQEAEQQEAENRRFASLTLYERIEEAGDMYDLKALLHAICDAAGIDQHQPLGD